MEIEELKISYRLACKDDINLYYKWVNDEEVRKQSFKSNEIQFKDHEEWFINKLNSKNSVLFLFLYDSHFVGQARIDDTNMEIATIDYSIDSKWRGKNLGKKVLEILKNLFNKVSPSLILKGIVKFNNISSIKAFQKAGFVKKEVILINNESCCVFYSN